MFSCEVLARSVSGLGRVKTLTCRSLEQFYVLRTSLGREFLGE